MALGKENLSLEPAVKELKRIQKIQQKVKKLNPEGFRQIQDANATREGLQNGGINDVRGLA